MKACYLNIRLIAASLILIFSQYSCSQKYINGSNAHIRFYTINKDNQLSEAPVLRDSSQPGCHNFRFNFKLYRAAQVGFSSCTIFRASNCLAESALIMEWKGEKLNQKSKRRQPTHLITPGALWHLPNNTQKKVSSWFCN